MRVPRLRLGVKLALAMVGSLTVLLTSLGFFYIREFRRSEETLIQQSADRLGDLIRRSTRTAMLRNDRNELSAMLPEIGRLPQLMRVRIYDKRGFIRYSSRPDEVGDKVDMTADACDRCHATAEPLKHLTRSDRMRIYRPDGQRVMGMIHPVPNEPDCASAACHVHPPDVAVLGVLDVQMSLQSVDETVAERRRSFLLTSVAILVVVSALSVLWAWRSVLRPVKYLLAATRQISAGNLDQRIPDKFDRDLSELVLSFNQMTSDLRAARRESEDWARTLEQRVEEKSQALRRAQDEMVQVEKMASLGKLAAIVAHEINNPLAGIRTYAKLLLKKIGRAAGAVSGREADRSGSAASHFEPIIPEEATEWLSRIESEAARCGDIVRNLLAFSRSSQPRIEATDLNTVIRQAMRLVQHQLDLSSIQGQTRLDPTLPLVECDPQQLKQALLAMLINACEAMPQGGELLVESRALGEPQDRPGAPGRDGSVEIRIRDTGIGMDAETRRHAFEPFFTTKDRSDSGGTGLGLAVVYGIVQSHGGTISVESAPGQGSLFTMVLPCHQPALSQGEEPHE